jgi:hypothetical protein
MDIFNRKRLEYLYEELTRLRRRNAELMEILEKQTIAQEWIVEREGQVKTIVEAEGYSYGLSDNVVFFYDGQKRVASFSDAVCVYRKDVVPQQDTP